MRALVLSSGGSRGHYQIGALKYLYKEKNTKHEIYCGTSMGALIGAYLTQYAYGHEHLGIDRLSELFLSLSKDSIYKKWLPLGMLHALLGKRSLYDSAPLRSLIYEHIDQLKILDTGKQLRIGVTVMTPVLNQHKGISNYKIYTERDRELLTAITASCALAPFFEPVKLCEGLGTDGGVQVVTPIKAAIDAGATDIDVITGYPTFLNYPKGVEPSAYHDALHMIDLMINRLTWVDIERARYVNSLVKSGITTTKRYINLTVIHPTADLETPTLDFERSRGMRLQKQGWDDAKLIVK
jgi:predicted acylesterase/phospholipase RssA